jgi:hypothetical protein
VFEAADRGAWGGMQHTNIPPVIHRDLKSPNVLISATWEAKVCPTRVPLSPTSASSA